MERLPFALLEAERTAMLERMRQLPITDSDVRKCALAKLEARVKNWRCQAMPAASQFGEDPPTGRPFVLTVDPAELWIVRAISPVGRPATFGVEADGAVCTTDCTGRYQIFVTGLSPLLDEAAILCRYVKGGGGSLLVERAGRFFTDFEADYDEALVVVKVKRDYARTRTRPKSLWQRVVSVLPWVHDQPEYSSRTASSKPEPAAPRSAPTASPASDYVKARPVYRLIVDFDAGAWPASGVLSELGYHVGKNGLGPDLRRRILRNAMTVELVATSAESKSYLRQWGPPNSGQRGAKIERCLAGFAAGARRKSADMAEAIADWDGDLEWFRVHCGR